MRSGSQKGISVEVTMCIAGVLVRIVDFEGSAQPHQVTYRRLTKADGFEIRTLY
jgi:hypothetical protein